MKMWILIIQYDYHNDILIFDNLAIAEEKYSKERESGKLVYLTKVIKTNI